MHDENEAMRSVFDGNGLTPPGFGGKSVAESLAEHPQGKIWQRRMAMSQWEILRDNFEDDHCRAFMMGTPPSMSPPQYPDVRPQRLLRDSHEPPHSKGRIGNA